MIGEDYLLDTCTLLYLMAGSLEIPPALEKLLAESSGDIFYSQVNLIEIQIMYLLGKLMLAEEPGILMSREIVRYPFERLELTHAISEGATNQLIAFAFRSLPTPAGISSGLTPWNYTGNSSI